MVVSIFACIPSFLTDSQTAEIVCDEARMLRRSSSQLELDAMQGTTARPNVHTLCWQADVQHKRRPNFGMGSYNHILSPRIPDPLNTLQCHLPARKLRFGKKTLQ